MNSNIFNLIYEKSLAFQASHSHRFDYLREYIEFIKKQSNFRNNWIEKYPDILFCIFFIYAVINRIYLLCEDDANRLLDESNQDNDGIHPDLREFCQVHDFSLPFIDQEKAFQDRFMMDLYDEIRHRGFSLSSSYEFYFDLCSIEIELTNNPEESFCELLIFLLSIYNKGSNENFGNQINNEDEELYSLLHHKFRIKVIEKIDDSSTILIDNTGRYYPLVLQDAKTETFISRLLFDLDGIHWYTNRSNFINHRCVLLNSKNTTDKEESLYRFIRALEERSALGILLASSSFIISPTMKDCLRAWARHGILYSIGTIPTNHFCGDVSGLINNYESFDTLISLSSNSTRTNQISISLDSYASRFWSLIHRTLDTHHDEVLSPTEAYVSVPNDMFIQCECSIDPVLYCLQKHLLAKQSNQTLLFKHVFSLVRVSIKTDDNTSQLSSSEYSLPLRFKNDSLLERESGVQVFVTGPALLANVKGDYLWLNENKTYEIIIPSLNPSHYFSGLNLQQPLFLPEYAIYLLTHPGSKYIWDILNNKSVFSNIDTLGLLTLSIPSIEEQWRIVSTIGNVGGTIKGSQVGISTMSRRALSIFEKKTNIGDNDRYFKLLAALENKNSSSINDSDRDLEKIDLSTILNASEISSLAQDFPNIIDYCCNAYKMDVSNKSLLQHSQPIELTKFCVSLLNPKPGSKIYVPFAGFGSYFKALSDCVCIGEEISPEVCSVANIRLSYSGITSRITCGDSMKTIDESPDKFDYIITTPPLFKMKGDNNNLDDGHFIRVLKGLYNKKLSNNGRMVIVAPLSFSYGTNFKSIKERLIKDGTIEMFISLPQVFLPLTSDYYGVIVINKNKNNSLTSSLLADGSSFFEESISTTAAGRFLYKELLDGINDINSDYCVKKILNVNNLNIYPRRFIFQNQSLQEGKQYIKLRKLITYNKCKKQIAISESPCIRSRDLFDHYCSFVVSPSSKCVKNKKYRLLTEPSALICFSKEYVKVGYVTEVPIQIENHIGAFSINEKIKPEYLLKELLSDYVKEQMKACMVFERRHISDIMNDLMDIFIATPSIHEQDIVLKNDAFKELEIANQKIKRQFDLYVEDTHMKKHAIGQNILNLRTYWDCLLQAREENNGNLPDDFALGIKHPLYVKEIIEKINMYLGEVSRGIENFTYAEDPRFKEKSDIVVDTFLRDYINTNTNPEYEIIYQPNLDNSSGQIHFSKVALKIILQNIISNAWQHGFKNRKEDNYIKVSWSETEDDLLIFISNNGCPIVDSMAQDELFKYGTSTRRGEADMEGHVHSGLGCYQIKALMNIDGQGDVTVKSNPKSEYPVTYILTFHKQ